jgi:hypothetical protein
MKTLITFLMIASFAITSQSAVPGKKPDSGRLNLRIPSADRGKARSTYGIRKNPLRGVNRTGVIEELGGSAETEAAVEKALDWLTKKQKNEGNCGYWEETSSKVAHTGLAVLCYLSYGVKPTDKGQDGNLTPNAVALKKGMCWLVDQVDKDGNMRDGGKMYDQSIGALALGEAYGITGDKGCGLALGRATAFLVKAQNPETGGWRYQPHPNPPGKPASDLSVSGWVIMALRSAEMSGIRVPNEPLDKSKSFLDSVGSGTNIGKYKYHSNKVPNFCMTSVGMFCQQLFGTQPDSERQIESAAYINLHLPREQQKNYYYWYYGTLATFLHGGKVWDEWNKKMKPIFLEKQNTDGSWKAEGKRAKKEGTHITTCWAALSLTVYYRYLAITNGVRRMNLGKRALARPEIKATPRINLAPKALPQKKN